MTDSYLTAEDMYKYEYNMKHRPHVVILGAGASCAAIPNGDRYGKRISAMSGFIEKLGLADIISKISIETDSDNLENIYMELDERSSTEPDCLSVKQELEHVIYEYMSDYELPIGPTVYDYLVLSLTSKDLIATFNWDPLLLQSYGRAMEYTNNLPRLAFLHGNVAVGYCSEDNTVGNAGAFCKCGKPFSPTKLLFPIKNKDYSSDTAIKKFWESLRNALEVAYMITIFGYSAPKSDKDAVAMLKKAWGAVEDRNLEEIELIDLRNEDEVVDSWQEFIHTHHYSYQNSFFDTTLGRCPRRSCEATFDRLMNNRWLKPNKGFKANMVFSEIDHLICDLVIDEEQKRDSKKLLINPYN